jgi:uncharacterized protein
MTGRLLTSPAEVRALAKQAKRVAVLGIKTEAQASQPAYYVPAYLAAAGIEVIPVPVYFPDVTSILGRSVVRRVFDAPPPIDIVVVFRRSEDVAPHLDDLLAARPKAVWMQQGIHDDEVAAKLTAAGIDVVMDRCIMVEHRAAG